VTSLDPDPIVTAVSYEARANTATFTIDAPSRRVPANEGEKGDTPAL
jgi:hypothetical protein